MSSGNVCGICDKEFPPKKLNLGRLLRPSLLTFITGVRADFDQEKRICITCLNNMRSDYILDLLKEDQGQVTRLELEVAESIKQNDTLSENIMDEYEDNLTFGQKLADKIAGFGGSWNFICIFFVLIIIWVGTNAYLLVKPADPYPFILLNLILSCLAAIQAPIILMSQNRQEARDRARAEYDYQVNLKAELEIRHLNEKIDLLLNHQWQNLIQIQQIQTDILEEIREKK